MQWRLARSKVYTQQCQTPLKATVIHLDNSRFFFFLLLFGKIKKLGAASTNRQNKKTNKSHSQNNESSSFMYRCTFFTSVRPVSCCCCDDIATPTGRGNGGEQNGEELPLYVNVKIPWRCWESGFVSSVTMNNKTKQKKISALL